MSQQLKTTIAVVDIETGATVDDPTIKPLVFQVGIAFGDTKGQIHKEVEFTLPFAEQVELGYIMQQDTVDWYNETEERAELLPEYVQASLAVEEDLYTIMHKIRDAFLVNKLSNSQLLVCANSPRFDLLILRHLFNDTEVSQPWDFRQEFDYRTARTLAKAKGLELEESKSHRAIEDASEQYYAMIKMCNHLGVEL